MYFGLFISSGELALLDRVGVEAFEARLQDAHADPFALARPPAS